MDSEKCRLCGAGLALISLTCGKSRKKREYIRKLTEVTTGVKFQKNDVSTYICVFCIATIYNFHVFKMKSLENERLLRSCIEKPLKTRKVKGEVSELCDIELPSVEILKTELFEWLKNKLDIQESVDTTAFNEKEVHIPHSGHFSNLNTNVNISSVEMIDKSTQKETHTFNVSCQYSVETCDEKIQCSILPITCTEEIKSSVIPVYCDKTTQTMKDTAILAGCATYQCDLNRQENGYVEIQYKPVYNGYQSLVDESQVDKVLTTVKSDENAHLCYPVLNTSNAFKVSENPESKSDINKNNKLSCDQTVSSAGDSSIISINKKSLLKKRMLSDNTKDKTCQKSQISITNFHRNENISSEASQVDENVEIMSSTIDPTVDDSSVQPLKSSESLPVQEKFCDKPELNASQSISNNGTPTANNSVKKNTSKRKSNALPVGTPCSFKKRRRNETSHQKTKGKIRINQILSPIFSVKTKTPTNEIKTFKSENVKCESVNKLGSKELSTAELLNEIDIFLSPKTIKSKTSSMPGSPGTPQNPMKLNSQQSSPFEYDTPRSSKLLTVKEKVEYVRICRECDQPLYSKSETAKHRKSHMRCHLCQKVFSSIKKTKEHIELECSQRMSKVVPFVEVVKLELCGYNLSDFLVEPKLSDKMSSDN